MNFGHVSPLEHLCIITPPCTNLSKVPYTLFLRGTHLLYFIQYNESVNTWTTPRRIYPLLHHQNNNRVDRTYKYKQIANDISVNKTDIVVTDNAVVLLGTITQPPAAITHDDNNEWKSIHTVQIFRIVSWWSLAKRNNNNNNNNLTATRGTVVKRKSPKLHIVLILLQQQQQIDWIIIVIKILVVVYINIQCIIGINRLYIPSIDMQAMSRFTSFIITLDLFLSIQKLLLKMNVITIK